MNETLFERINAFARAHRLIRTADFLFPSHASAAAALVASDSWLCPLLTPSQQRPAMNSSR